MAKLRLKKDIVIKAGTLFDDKVPESIQFGSDNFEHVIGFGKNASGSLFVGAEEGDPEFDQYFERVGSRRIANRARR